MKYIYMAAAFAIVAITIWFVWKTPACETGYSISAEGFICNSASGKTNDERREQPKPITEELEPPKTVVTETRTQASDVKDKNISITGVKFTSKWWKGYSTAGDKHCGKGVEWKQFLWNGTSKMSLCVSRTKTGGYVEGMATLTGNSNGQCKAKLGTKWTNYMWDGVNKVQLCIKWTSLDRIKNGGKHFNDFTAAWKKTCPTKYVNLTVIKPDLRICGRTIL